MMIQSDVTMIQIAVENAGCLTYRADNSCGTLSCGKRGMPKRNPIKRYCPTPTADVEDPDTDIGIMDLSTG